MKNYLRKLYSYAILICISPSLYGQLPSPTDSLFYQYALVRDLSNSMKIV